MKMSFLTLSTAIVDPKEHSTRLGRRALESGQLEFSMVDQFFSRGDFQGPKLSNEPKVTPKAGGN